ncbi:hypothetical protein NQ315_016510 [Exocentrus adspersus]|uniref:Uncharacterized protein n=1 Tax=Exocentrus adspersus TaxID=1586481 RepID=A0AAV8VZU4_9CUCU|nr:hypothetical protein NQ315_016510 [Exocentrus adspersus]
MVTNNGIFNRRNTHYWSQQNLHLLKEVRHQHRFGFNMWVGIFGTRIAERTADCVYLNNWQEHLTPHIKVAQTMIIARGQKQTLILAGGFIKVDMEVCLNAVKAMVSYAMFLKNVALDRDDNYFIQDTYQ